MPDSSVFFGFFRFFLFNYYYVKCSKSQWPHWAKSKEFLPPVRLRYLSIIPPPLPPRPLACPSARRRPRVRRSPPLPTLGKDGGISVPGGRIQGLPLLGGDPHPMGTILRHAEGGGRRGHAHGVAQPKVMRGKKIKVFCIYFLAVFSKYFLSKENVKGRKSIIFLFFDILRLFFNFM